MFTNKLFSYQYY